jgi:hypothetical protein
MAGKGMGIATKGGGAVEKGARNRMEFNPTKGKTKPLMMAMGGDVNQHKQMAMGMMGGGMMKKGYAAGGAVKKKMMAGGGKRGK